MMGDVNVGSNTEFEHHGQRMQPVSVEVDVKRMNPERFLMNGNNL